MRKSLFLGITLVLFSITKIHSQTNTFPSSGNVGVGTTTPFAKVHAYSSSDELFRLESSLGTGSPYASFWQSGTRRGFIQFVNSNNSLKIASEYGRISLWAGDSNNETEVARFTNLGITHYQSTKMATGAVISAPDGTPVTRFNRADNNINWWLNHAGNRFALSESGGNDFIIGLDSGSIDQGNSLGIGVPAGAYRLNVNGSTRLDGNVYLGTHELQFLSASGGNNRIHSDGGIGTGTWRFKSRFDNIVLSAGENDSNPRRVIFQTGDTERMRIDSNGRIGIGTASPNSILHVQASSEGEASDFADFIVEQKDAHIDIISSSDDAWGSSLNFIEGNGSTNTDSWSIVRQTTNGTGDSSLRFNFGTINNHTNGNKVTFKSDGKVGIGTTNPDHELTVKGKIHAEEILVDLNVPGPDYVFEADYDLPTLSEIEAFIKANKHLPEVPPAARMEEEGITLGEMNMLLLKKIEELTLHTINQQKEITYQKSINKDHQQQVANQEQLIWQLISRIEQLESKTN